MRLKPIYLTCVRTLKRRGLSFLVMMSRIVKRALRLRVFRWLAICCVFFVSSLSILFFTPPLDRSEYPQVFVVSKGESVRSIGRKLQHRGIINSSTLFVLSSYMVGGKILWGSYHFTEPRSTFLRAYDLYNGDRGRLLRKVVVPEKSNVYDIADIFEEEFEGFVRSDFLDVALEQHGYLYPDTYLFAYDYDSPVHLIDVMTETFRRRTEDLFAAYEGEFSRDEIVTLASIVELEASDYTDRRKIAGVLFNRLRINMPLQVDVSFLFIDDKHTFNLSRKDLAINDPSNTYKYAGIPPIPIANPSRESVEAVMNPIASNDLYFLADFYGNTHYSETYQEHLRKKRQYIDSVVHAQRERPKVPVAQPTDHALRADAVVEDSASADATSTDASEG